MRALLNVREDEPDSRVTDSMNLVVAFSSWRDMSGARTTSVTRGAVGDLVALVGEEDPFDTAAGGEDFLDFLADALLSGFGLDGGAAVGEPFVEVFLEAEPVAVALDREVVAGLRERLQGGLDVADVEARLGDGEADFGLGGFALGLAAVGLEEDGGGDFAVEASVFDGVLGFGIEPGGVGAFLAADVSRDRAFELGLAQLLEDGRAEHGVFERGGTQADEGVFVAAFEALLVRVGDPEGQHAEHAAGLLEPGQLLPFALEDGNGSGVEGIGGGEWSRAASSGNQLGNCWRCSTTQSPYSLQVSSASLGSMTLPSVVMARSSHSKSRRRMISEASASADMTMALPRRSSIFLNRS